MEDLKTMATNELQIQQPPPLWLVKPCNTAGCSVMIRVQVEFAASVHNCKWCQTNTDYNTDTSHVRPHVVNGDEYLSKDEFGQDLFEAIRLQAAIRQAEKTAEIYRKKGITRREREALDQVKSLNHELQGILKNDTIETTDLQRVLAIR